MTINIHVLKSNDTQAYYLLYHLHALHFAHTTYLLLIFLTINTDYFPKQYQPASFNGGSLFSVG